MGLFPQDEPAPLIGSNGDTWSPRVAKMKQAAHTAIVPYLTFSSIVMALGPQGFLKRMSFYMKKSENVHVNI